MRDGHYDVVYARSLKELCDAVNKKRSIGYTPQAQPFKFNGNICQAITKVDHKPMKDDRFIQECNRRGVTPIENQLLSSMTYRNKPIGPDFKASRIAKHHKAMLSTKPTDSRLGADNQTP